MPAPQRVVVVRPINHVLHITLCSSPRLLAARLLPMLAHRGMQK